MDVNEEIYDRKIHFLMEEYNKAMDTHRWEMEKLMEMQSIPIYTRWSELKAAIQAFEQMRGQIEKALRFLDRMHNASKSKEN